MPTTLDAIRGVVASIARRECSMDDPNFSVCDYAGGNIDDAHSLGYDNGLITLAREIMELLDS